MAFSLRDNVIHCITKETMDMSERQNVTLSLRASLLRTLRHAAVDRGTSLSGLVTEVLEQWASRGQAYDEARDRQISNMEKGLNLGTRGRIDWSRESLHER